MALTDLAPILKLVPTPSILFHENPERPRTLRLMERIEEEAFLRHPPIVAKTGQGKYLLLDGANRVSAFAELGYSHVPVQVVDYHHESIELKGWHHLLVGAGDLDLFKTYSAMPGISLVKVTHDKLTQLLKTREVLAVLVNETTEAYGLFSAASENDLQTRTNLLTQLVAAYEGKSPIERIKLADFSLLPKVVKTVAHQLLLVPPFLKTELLKLVELNLKIPTGLSRHLIPGRALGINLEIGFIREMKSEAEKLTHFKDFTTHLQLKGRIRFYEESVFMMNE